MRNLYLTTLIDLQFIIKHIAFVGTINLIQHLSLIEHSNPQIKVAIGRSTKPIYI